NLRDGVESIRRLAEPELLAAGVGPDLLRRPDYVRAAPVLDGVDLFDAAFFGFNPREAEALDPQQRLFLECAWECLEAAGYDPARYTGRIGVFAGSRWPSYAWNLFTNPEVVESLDGLSVQTSLDKDYLATRAAYHLDLRGPSLSVQTACSTSLVAVHLARQAILSGDCEMALVGGVSVQVPQEAGYLFREGSILSPDGHCRAFDARGRGTLFGSGVGAVLLKPLSEALRDGDRVRAVLKGSAINNDGVAKVGYTAPGVEGQAAVIAAAQEAAGVSPDTITYVEAHGTATPLGDPIEIAALTRAFRAGTARRGFCAVGSLKTNLGHLDAAAGIAGLLKTALALEHRQIPPSLHFEEPNPAIDFASSPFYVNARLADWEADGPRRAGVSSFGIGGANAHAILEEPPERQPGGPSRPWQLLVLSARTETALEAATGRLAGWLDRHPEAGLADVAFTLQAGRRSFEHRRALVCAAGEPAAALLAERSPERVLTRRQEAVRRPVVFLFPGQGSQHVDMARGLYDTEPVFRRELDACAGLLSGPLGLDLREVLFPAPERRDEAERALRRTRLAQPALFAVEYALARLWESWGVEPAAFLGHSLGEYVAACLAGIFSLPDALALVAARGELMEATAAGAMLSVERPESEIAPWLGPGLSLAAVNAPSLCAVSGPEEEIARLEARLGAAVPPVPCRRLHTSHAFHSGLMEPALGPFGERVARIGLRPPERPFLSNLTGDWIRAEEATDPGYWVRHLRGTVRFSQGLERLLSGPATRDAVLLEVGPGAALAHLARQQPGLGDRALAVSSLRRPRDPETDSAALGRALARLWLLGVEIDWDGFHAGERRLRVELPTYPFERRRFWIAPRPARPAPALHLPGWKRSLAPAAAEAPARDARFVILAPAGQGN
ncbi:MAG TPA: type I polyketide synthase, partial [Thermoanaerobaculia bacterium]|nr:type I polyketide synthase [Thermoanaerobaculia bacterium]